MGEAASLLAKYGDRAKIIAGGTDLLVEEPSDVEYLIDIASLPMDYIKDNGEEIKIGALSTIRGIEISSLFKQGACRILAEAAHDFGHASLRNMATIGGNVCVAVPSADFPTVLLALDARAKLVARAGERTVPIEEFFVAVRKTVLKGDELLVEIQIPKPPAHTGTAFIKLGRTSVDIAVVNVATRITLRRKELCEDARIVLGAVAPTPIRAKRAEELLKGKRIDSALIEEASQIASEETKPISDIRSSADYRREMSRILVKRALRKALERAEEGL
jgi:carbon-monoxide dehydrogenase medium subunit